MAGLEIRASDRKKSFDMLSSARRMRYFVRHNYMKQHSIEDLDNRS